MNILLSASAFLFSVGMARAQGLGDIIGLPGDIIDHPGDDIGRVPEVGVTGGLASMTLVGGFAALAWERRRRR